MLLLSLVDPSPHEELPRASRTNPKGISDFLSLFPGTHQREVGEELRKTHINMKCQHSNTGAEGRQGMVTEMLGVLGHPKCHRSMNACHCLVCLPTNQSKLIFIDWDMKP